MYQTNPVPVLTREEAQFIDQHVEEAFAIPLLLLMENAGRGIAHTLVEDQASGVLFVCGVGNNGADALVAARHLQEQAIPVALYIHGDLEKATPLFKQQYAMCQALHIVEVPSLDGLDWTQFSQVVEGLVGTGLKGPLREDLRDTLYTMNAFSRAHGCALWAIDIAAGLDANTGQVDEATPVYTGTMTFGAYKQGQWLYPGRDHSGLVQVLPLGLDWAHLLATKGREADLYPTYVLDQDFVSALLQPRISTAHKGLNGHVALLGGSPGMTGAPAIAANASVWAGAGKTTLMSDEAVLPSILTHSLPEVMAKGLSSSQGIASAVEGIDVLAMGPGLGRTESARQLIEEALQCQGVNFVLDADALYAISPLQEGDDWSDCLMTPHIGEFARMLNLSTKKVLENYIPLARETAMKYGMTLVLKGIPSLVALPTGEVYINSAGNPGMGSGGMGDALTGIVAALLAQGYSYYEAAILGTYIHSLAADQLAKDRPWGYRASDVAAQVGYAINTLLGSQDVAEEA